MVCQKTAIGCMITCLFICVKYELRTVEAVRTWVIDNKSIFYVPELV